MLEIRNSFMDIGHVLNVRNKNKLHQNIIDAMRSKGFIKHIIYIKVSMEQSRTRFGILKYLCYIRNMWRKKLERKKMERKKMETTKLVPPYIVYNVHSYICSSNKISKKQFKVKSFKNIIHLKWFFWCAKATHTKKNVPQILIH